MAEKGLKADIERVLATMARFFADEGNASQVAILAFSKYKIDQSSYEDRDGGQYGYTISLELPAHLYAKVNHDRQQIENVLTHKANDVTRMFPDEYFDAFRLVSELDDDPDWREKAKAWVTGEGITNQGRARSDNIAPRMAD